MPYNGSGSFTPPGADFPAVASTLIESTKFNNVVNDIATGLSTAITKDGQTTITANIPLNGNRLTGVGAGSASTDAATIGGTETLTNKTLTSPTINTPTVKNPTYTTQALTDAAPTAWDASSGQIATWTMGASRTLSAPSNLKAGGRYVLIITQDGTGGRQVTWNAVFKNAAGSMPQPNQQANAVTAFTFTSPDGTNLRLETNEAMVLLATSTASSSSSIDFTNLVGFSTYMFTLENVVPATDATALWMRLSTNNGSSFAAGANDYGYAFNYNLVGSGTGSTNSGADTKIILASDTDNSTPGHSGVVHAYGLAGASNYKIISAVLMGVSQTPAYFSNSGGGAAQLATTGNAAVNAVRFIFSSGNIASGTIKCYGIRG